MLRSCTRFLKFLVIGVLNTCITFFVFNFLIRSGVSLDLSNAVGYIAGLINSFIWNKKWVFKTVRSNVLKEFFSFIIVFFVCYLIQLLFFHLVLKYVNESVAQILGMGVYTIMNYLMNKYFSFKVKKG